MSDVKNKQWDRIQKNLLRERAELSSWFKNRFRSLFMSSLEWDGFTLEEKRFICQTLWLEGKVAGVRCKGDFIAFSRVANVGFNIYGNPTDGQAVTLNGDRIVPSGLLKTDNVQRGGERDEAAPLIIGFALPTLLPIEYAIKPWVDDLVGVEMAIRTNTAVQNVPFLLKATQNNERKTGDALDQAMLGAHRLVLGVDEQDSIDVLNTGAPYLLDKLEQRKDHLEKEVLTFLGVDNLKEKPERMQGDEINANNNEININQESILENLQDWCERMNKAFGTSYSIKAKMITQSIYQERSGKETDDEGPDHME